MRFLSLFCWLTLQLILGWSCNRITLYHKLRVLQEISCKRTMFCHYNTIDDLLDPRDGYIRLFYRPTVVILDIESSYQYCVFSFEKYPCLRVHNFLHDNPIQVLFSITFCKMTDLMIFMNFS